MNDDRPERIASALSKVQGAAWLPWAWPVDVRWAVLLITGVALLGAWATEIGAWYLGLVQPPWKPPDWAFGPIWTALYVTTGWAGVRTWRRLEAGPDQSAFLLACLINAMLNVLWSTLYFTLRRPDWALWEGVALWLSAAWVATLMARVDRFSSFLMVPHLAWLGLAWALNLATVRLNPLTGS